MLVLSRQVNETIRIGNDITVTVSRFRGGTVFLGVNAPREVPVHREEVWREIQRERDSDGRSKPE